MAPLDFSNAAALWSGVLAETLFRSGVRQAVIAPGSRSAPLAFAFARHPGIEALPVLDERSAGFLALGLAKRGGKPVVLACTSGTAAANLLPAVVEARESAVPLIVLTADRPPELRACAAGQAIDQQKLYGAYPNFHHELGLPEADLRRLAYARQTVLHARLLAERPQPGPVHLNVPFRDPLAPVRDGTVGEAVAGADWEAFFSCVEAARTQETDGSSSRPRLLPEMQPRWKPRSAGRGLVIAGPAEPADSGAYADGLKAIADRLQWPVLADALSPGRQHAGRVPGLVTAYDAILRQDGAAGALRPDFVLILEGLPTSKVLRQRLEDWGAPTALATERWDNRDALHGRTEQLALGVSALARCLDAGSGRKDYLAAWSAAEQKARAALDTRFERETGFAEPKAAWLLNRHLPRGTTLFVANSMPVRDLEYFWPGSDRGLAVRFNRGANGIDGTLSTALGLAHGGGPAVLLTGDLALLHDTNGFLVIPRLKGSLTIVLINNQGGGIFEHLPVSRFDPPFEDFFATPQKVDFPKLCSGYGVEHVLVRDWEHFVGLVSALPGRGVRVLELRTDRKADADWRRRVLAEAGA